MKLEKRAKPLISIRYRKEKMDEREKKFDAILTTGARWLMVRKRDFPYIDGFAIKDVKLNDLTYGFLAIARVYVTYEDSFYIQTNIFKYLYLKYIKRFKFLKRINGNIVDYIDVNIFLSELVNAFDEKLLIIEEIYKHYYTGK